MEIREIGGFQIEVTRKNIKNLHLRVRPDGTITLSVPRFTTDWEIKRFINLQHDWIQSKLDTRTVAPQDYATGESLSVWGETYTLKVTQGPKFSLILLSGEVHLQCPAGSTREEREDYLREWYRKELKKKMAQRTPYWEQYTGLHASKWTTRDMSTRWGSCNPKTGHITLNVQLAKHPPVCLDYVILHELAHLKAHGHGADFKAILDQYMPDWREVRKILKG